MSKAVLNPKEFGDRIYERFPNIYRVKDEEEAKKALYRYITAIGDGGFAPIIEDVNKLLTFYDAEKVDMSLIPIIFKSFGFEIFNGIPENYIRNLLPVIGDLFERKGSVEVVEYLTTVIANVKSTIEVITKDGSTDARFGKAIFGEAIFDDEGKTTGIIVTLELDYGVSDKDLPDEAQIKRIIREFLPFYCFVTVIYSFIYFENEKFRVKDNYNYDIIKEQREDIFGVLLHDVVQDTLQQGYLDRDTLVNTIYNESSAVFGDGIFGSAVFGNSERRVQNPDEYTESIEYFARERENLGGEDIDTNSIIVFNNDIGSISFSETEESVKIQCGYERTSIISDSYLPEGSAIFGGGQPMGLMLFGANRPYTTMDYTVDKVTHISSGNSEEIIRG